MTISSRMSVGQYNGNSFSVSAPNPVNINTDTKRSITSAALKATIPVALTMSTGKAASASDKIPESVLPTGMPLGDGAYTKLGDMPMCRILNGMWQLSGAHGFEPQLEKALAEMSHCADSGFTTFDLADHYGPAEEYVGVFSKGRLASPLAKDCQFFTKWVPRPEEITRRMAGEAVDRSRRRMGADRIDLLQFHW
jgi:Aldo/keto reductase family